MRRTVIYDFGSNNGDDLPYYLKKADLVVAVEANPTLARQIEQRFAKEIVAGSLCVENCVLAVDGAAPLVPFYIHNELHFLSQFPPPANSGDFTEVLLPARSPIDLINKHGPPHYIKIDIEHYDAAILRELLDTGVRPPYISAESHSIEVFALLVVAGYGAFNLVEGATVDSAYNEHWIETVAGTERYSFPRHSAGPFGADIHGAWATADNFFKYLALRRLGWKDVHASSVIPPETGRFADLNLRERRPWPARLVKRVLPAALIPLARKVGRLV